jgi:hypothetical protein
MPKNPLQPKFAAALPAPFPRGLALVALGSATVVRQTPSSLAHLGRGSGDITDDFAYLDAMGANKMKEAGPKLLPSQTRTPDAFFTPYLPHEEGDEVPEYKVTPFTTDASDDFAYLENLDAHQASINAVDTPLPDAAQPMGGEHGTATLGTTSEADAKAGANAKAKAKVEGGGGGGDAKADTDADAAAGGGANAGGTEGASGGESGGGDGATPIAISSSSEEGGESSSPADDARLGKTNFIWNKETNQAVCPSAAAMAATGAGAAPTPAANSPLSTFTSLGANLLIAGDSTDKLWWGPCTSHESCCDP